MKSLLFKLCFFFLTSTAIVAQKNTTTLTYKKGEILDVLVLSTTTKDPGKLFERYKQTAFPIASEYTYQPQPGFAVTELTLGTQTPSTFAFGKWNNKQKREGFLASISKRLPDFHQQRRDLFPFFGLAYYEVKKDVEFSIDKTKYNVVTSFWKKDESSLKIFLSKWKKEIKKAGGKIVLQLKDGTSPLGYDYNPDVLVIIKWNDKKAFQKFAKNHPLETYNDLKNVHQFVIG